jgi:hypothetical protein
MSTWSLAAVLHEAEEREIAEAVAALPGEWIAERGEPDELGPDMRVTFIRVRDLGQIGKYPVFAIVRSASETFVAALAGEETCATAPVMNIAQALRVVQSTVRCLIFGAAGNELRPEALQPGRNRRPAPSSLRSRRWRYRGRMQ